MSLLEIRNLHAGYGQMTILKGIDMTLEAGEIGVIVGPNGAGKSTTLKAIFGMLNITEGSIHFDGHDITGISPEKLAAHKIAMVPQEHNVFATLTVHENLEMGAYARRELARAIELSGLPFQVNGRGSLFMLHLHGRDVTDYRSAFRSPAEKARHDQLQRYFLNNGFLLSPLGLGAISTPMGPGEIDRLAETLLRGLREINWELADA